MNINLENILKVPFNILEEHSFIPVVEYYNSHKSLKVFTLNEPSKKVLNVLNLYFGDLNNLNIVFISDDEINRNLYRVKNKFIIEEFVNKIKLEIKTDIENNTLPAVKMFIEYLLKHAIKSEASDIHIDVTEKHTIIKERVDGFLQELISLDLNIFNPISSAIKLLSHIDIAKKQYAHDGRFSMYIDDFNYDFRVSTIPTIYGESIVIRILDNKKEIINLDSLGISSDNLLKLKNSISLPYGLVLVTGPTGSGKTTTLYGALENIVDERYKIITLEDPVEYKVNGVQQVQLENKIGFDYKTALKFVLRQDPDKLMIGEIRDKDTLNTAIELSLTGHMVLSTLHTNDSLLAITRMIDMGLEPYLIAGTVKSIVAQRLIRKLCPNCKIVDESLKSISDISSYITNQDVLYSSKGCNHCFYTGYKGREVISEILIISDEISRAISSNLSKEEIMHIAKVEGFTSMFEDGLKKVVSGITTLEEIYRVIH